MESKLIQLTDELWEAIEYARGDNPRGPWIEKQLRRLAIVKQAAAELGVDFPDRPRPGTYDRSGIIGKPRGTRVKKARK